MRALRSALSQAEQDAAAQAVLERLKTLKAYTQTRCVMAYAAARGELSLTPVMEELLDRDCMLALPRCEAPGVMTARRVESLSQLAPGAYGLAEPSPACEILDPALLDLILVPGAAFDCRGGRIGQGGGYYDRFLGKTDALRVGVCHGFALLDAVPKEAHDMRMDFVLTPQGIVRCE